MNLASLTVKIPRWFPLKVITTVNIAGFLATIVAVVCWTEALKVQTKNEQLNDQIRAHYTLVPPLQALRERNNQLRKALASQESTPMPKNLGALLLTMETLARDCGIEDVRFVPDSQTLVSGNTVRLTGAGSAPTEAIRKFFITMHYQSWSHDIETLTLKAATGAPVFSMTLHADFASLDSRGQP